jgi:tetrahydromethanopterin S-methyltransferase subunit C
VLIRKFKTLIVLLTPHFTLKLHIFICYGASETWQRTLYYAVSTGSVLRMITFIASLLASHLEENPAPWLHCIIIFIAIKLPVLLLNWTPRHEGVVGDRVIAPLTL